MASESWADKRNTEVPSIRFRIFLNAQRFLFGFIKFYSNSPLHTHPMISRGFTRPTRCVSILVYCSVETGHGFVASSELKIAGIAVQLLSNSLWICFSFSFLESGLKNIRNSLLNFAGCAWTEAVFKKN